MLKLKELYGKYKNWVVIILLVLFLFKSCQNSMNKRALNWKTTQYGYALNESDSTLNAVVLKYERTIDSMDRVIETLRNELSFEKASADQLKSTNSKLWESNQNLSGSVRDLTKDNEKH